MGGPEFLGYPCAPRSCTPVGCRQEDFARFKRLCEEHFREEEEVTLPALRRHFTPSEVQPVAKKISKMYSLLDMGECCGGPQGPVPLLIQRPAQLSSAFRSGPVAVTGERD